MSDTPLALDGLVTGLNTSDIINQLMSVERQPLLRLQARQADYDARVTAWNDISSSLAGLRTSILDILSPTKFNLFSATSSDTSRLTATAGTNSTAGTTTFRVNTLAAAHQVMSQAFASS